MWKAGSCPRIPGNGPAEVEVERKEQSGFQTGAGRGRGGRSRRGPPTATPLSLFKYLGPDAWMDGWMDGMSDDDDEMASIVYSTDGIDYLFMASSFV